MSKMYISYQAFPNCYEATQYSRGRAGVSAALRLLGVVLSIFSCIEFVGALTVFAERGTIGNLFDICAVLLCVLVFDFYAFIWRMYETKFGLKLIFIDAEYRQATVYGDTKRSKEFIEKCEEKRIDDKCRARKQYRKTLQKAAIIYGVSALTVLLMIALLTIF